MLALYGCWSTPDLIGRWGLSASGLALFAAWVALALAVLRRPRSRATWAGIALAGIALRVGAAVITAGRVSPGDPRLYVELAHHLLSGAGLVVHEPFLGLDVRGFFPPLYPVLLAGWGAIAGFSTASLLLLSTLIDLATAALIVRLSNQLGERAAGVVAAALYLIWPSVLFSAPLAQKEGLATLLVLALASGWLHAGEAARPVRAAWRIGLPAAALALTQPGQAPLALLFGLALLPSLGWRRLFQAGVPAAAIAGLAMLPWWVRNALVFGRFVPLTTVSGLSLWIGSGPGATGGWQPYPRAAPGVDEIAYAQAAGRHAWAWIATHPLDTARLCAAKFVRALGLGQAGIVRLLAMRPAFPAPALLVGIAQGSQILLLGLASAAAARSPGQRTLLALLAAGFAQLLFFALPFEFGERHREFLMPFLLLLVAGWHAQAKRRVTV